MSVGSTTPTSAPFRLDGKTALITGAASGIGAAIARLFARQGANVFIGDLNADQAANVVSEIIAAGGQATFVRLDIGDPTSVDEAFATVQERTGAEPNLLVNNAGIAHVGDILNTTIDDWERLMRVNARGVFLCSQAFVRAHRESGKGGAIVNIASIASKVALSERFAYSATKGAVIMMTRALACDHIADGIRCNCICPARVHTPFVDAFLAKNYPNEVEERLAALAKAQPMGRMGTPDEIAGLALYLASDEAGYVTGVAYDIDGGTLAMR